jgi:isoquinoline 1-oxidoreductase beta subunit
MIENNKISRRYFIRNLSLFSGGLVLACELGSEEKLPVPNDDGNFTPNLFIELKPDGELILTASRSEMGQGVRTSLTAVIADEMDADWNRVKVVQAPGDDAYGNQNTDGSRSIRTIYEPMRKMGAMARTMLVGAAAKRWQVLADQCSTKKHYVINNSSGERLFYGDLIEEAMKQPLPESPVLKNPDEFVYIGKGLRSVDIDDFTSGRAVYGLDIKLPGMKYATIARCPVTFGSVKSFDSSGAEEIQGVEKVLEMSRVKKPFGSLGGVAVIANNSWSAIKGKEALKIEWDFGENQDYNTVEYASVLKSNATKKGKLLRED